MRTIVIILGFLAATGPALASMPATLAQKKDRPHSRTYARATPRGTHYSRSRSSR